ncbi:outer membrane protein OmpK [Stutzerimonas stutzeri]|uniref:outer membrane protein OmpK n=1 Tax=Stutzerimonas stutzeri TaxID=316 RepID=UPI000395FC55|nr:outer membrane protein OmpK [Stutzerimonas stutzeri]EQM77104.1 membrane protein [Stutzerimonas stutzeri MF28]
MKRILTTAALAAGMMLAGQAMAAPLIWQNNSLTYLYGKNFAVDSAGGKEADIQQIVTFEHASGWTWGDIFMFVDNKWYNGISGGAGYTYYGEFQPRLSLGKITGRDFSFGPIKDVLLAGTYERGESNESGQPNISYLLGPAVDLAVPGFDRVSVNTYYRKPDGERGKASGQWQITPTWAMTIPLGKSDILFDGYIDWAINDVGNKGSSDYVAKNLHINPQIKYDLGKALDQKPGKLYVGIEYDYWTNKYGIEDSGAFNTDQSVVQAIAKLHF